MSNLCHSGKPSQMQHFGASNPSGSLDTPDFSSNHAQAQPLFEADIAELSQHIGSRTLLPQPLQLLCAADRTESAQGKDIPAGEQRSTTGGTPTSNCRASFL